MEHFCVILLLIWLCSCERKQINNICFWKENFIGKEK